MKREKKKKKKIVDHRSTTPRNNPPSPSTLLPFPINRTKRRVLYEKPIDRLGIREEEEKRNSKAQQQKRRHISIRATVPTTNIVTSWLAFGARGR